LFGGRQGDVIDGDTGRDSIDGESGDDSLFGGEGADTLHGGDGNDYLDGGAWRDSIFGELNNDTIVFYDAEADTVDGGADIDRILLGETELDLDNIGDEQITSVEILDLNLNGSSREVTIDGNDVLNFNASTGQSFNANTIGLFVRGDGADIVNLDADGGSDWTFQGSQAYGGEFGGATYNVYSNGSEWIAIESGISVNT
jgi:hypothetical protein